MGYHKSQADLGIDYGSRRPKKSVEAVSIYNKQNGATYTSLSMHI
jgi:hypothetical protein